MHDAHHTAAAVAVAASTIAIPAVWLSDLDIIARIVLSTAGTISALCAARYYWRKTK